MVLALLSAGLVTADAARAQVSREVPIQRDLDVERRLDRNAPPTADPNVSPDNPDGVVGFDGPPGIPENNIDAGPLPPGSPADADIK
ncbi:hypothetical protein DK427_19975 [Methylobacterium radiodurans]|uniref:Uncharacterized protein n=1 Tax=Methylobacterium radiodurans TaxID=2202828 RepID=A0A2U8W1H6_9HYPH|nr:hypothetical protein DK427_19975 [Methylobacterium radiodurans]